MIMNDHYINPSVFSLQSSVPNIYTARGIFLLLPACVLVSAFPLPLPLPLFLLFFFPYMVLDYF